MNKKITIALCIFLTLTIVFYYVTQSSYVYANMNVDDAVTIANEMDKDIGTKKRISDMTDNELKEFLSVYTISYNTLDDSKKKTM